MEKHTALKDGTPIVIRPLTIDDLEKSYEFFQSLPAEDRQYLRVDVTKKELVEKRIRMMEYVNVKRLVALADDKIIADGALELEGHSWKAQLAELRLIIARSYQRKGLGVIMAGELYQLATQESVEEIVVKIMKPQVGAQSIFKKLGFHEDALLTSYVKDLYGHKQDLIIMRCKLKELWQELEDYFYEKDFRRMVTHMY